MNDLADICVIGGGPAGASLALRLASFGRRVVLIEKTASPKSCIGESLTGGILPLLDVIGLRAEFENAGFLSSPQVTSFWAGQLRQRDTHGGYQVDRGKFDALLLEAAWRAGVDILRPDKVVCLAFDQYWSIRLESGAIIHSQFIAEASGRSRVLPGSRSPTGFRSLAIYSYWSDVEPLDGNTLIEAGTSQWYWGAPLPGGLFNAAVFVDPAKTRLDHYIELIRQSSLLSGRICHGSHGEVCACAATPFLDDSVISYNHIKVGAAAISIDAISSQGVQTAIGTAFHAAVVLNTIIDRPSDGPVAMEFYRRRLRDSSAFHSRSARLLYHEQLALTNTDFWGKLAGAKLDGGIERREPLTLNECVRKGAQVAFVTVPVATDRYIVQTDGVEWRGKTAAFIGGVSVARLLREVTEPMPTRELIHRWTEIMPRDKALQTVQWAWIEGLIEKVS